MADHSKHTAESLPTLEQLVAAQAGLPEGVSVSTALIANVAPDTLTQALDAATFGISLSQKRELDGAEMSYAEAQVRYDVAMRAAEGANKKDINKVDGMLDQIIAERHGIEAEGINIATIRAITTPVEKAALLARDTRALREQLGRGATIRRTIAGALLLGGIFSTPGVILEANAHSMIEQGTSTHSPSEVHFGEDAQNAATIVLAGFAMIGVGLGATRGVTAKRTARAADRAAQHKAQTRLEH